MVQGSKRIRRKVDAGWSAGLRAAIRLVIQDGNERDSVQDRAEAGKRQGGRVSFIGWEGQTKREQAEADWARMPAQRADRRWEWKSKLSTCGRDAPAERWWAEAAD